MLLSVCACVRPGVRGVWQTCRWRGRVVERTERRTCGGAPDGCGAGLAAAAIAVCAPSPVRTCAAATAHGRCHPARATTATSVMPGEPHMVFASAAAPTRWAAPAPHIAMAHGASDVEHTHVLPVRARRRWGTCPPAMLRCVAPRGWVAAGRPPNQRCWAPMARAIRASGSVQHGRIGAHTWRCSAQRTSSVCVHLCVCARARVPARTPAHSGGESCQRPRPDGAPARHHTGAWG